MDQKELPDQLYDKVTDLSEAGDELVEKGRFKDGLLKYEAALALLPRPREQWEAFTWLMAAVGDAHFAEGDHAGTVDAMERAMKGPDAIGNPFIHLRLGEARLELGHEKAALDELVRAYMGAGEEIFANEDPKYLKLVKASIKPSTSSKDRG
jgi:hypothetical protein